MSSTAPTSEQLREQWNQMAPIFVASVQTMTTDAHRGLLQMLRLHDAGALLEVGCGGGGLAEVARGLLPAEARQVITDLSPAMLAFARERNPQAEAQEADAGALPFPDASFDRYLAALNLMLVPDPARALAEAWRVLRPGGYAAFSVWGRRRNSPLMQITQRSHEKISGKISGNTAVPPLPARSNFHLSDRKKLRKLSERAGFDFLLCWDQPMLVPSLSGAEHAEEIQRSQPRLRLMLEGLPEEDRAAWLRQICRLADRRLRRHRPIMLEIRMVLLRKPLPDLSIPDEDTEESQSVALPMEPDGDQTGFTVRAELPALEALAAVPEHTVSIPATDVR